MCKSVQVACTSLCKIFIWYSSIRWTIFHMFNLQVVAKITSTYEDFCAGMKIITSTVSSCLIAIKITMRWSEVHKTKVLKCYHILNCCPLCSCSQIRLEDLREPMRYPTNGVRALALPLQALTSCNSPDYSLRN